MSFFHKSNRSPIFNKNKKTQNPDFLKKSGFYFAKDIKNMCDRIRQKSDRTYT
ncbi:MAG: hypothetical protein KAF91_23690 [Nostoc sp. TH1S01]|nr:hypothetical protein [Nostoc sp. TH1S01]